MNPYIEIKILTSSKGSIRFQLPIKREANKVQTNIRLFNKCPEHKTQGDPLSSTYSFTTTDKESTKVFLEIQEKNDVVKKDKTKRIQYA